MVDPDPILGTLGASHGRAPLTHMFTHLFSSKSKLAQPACLLYIYDLGMWEETWRTLEETHTNTGRTFEH
ncbi:hypothetical protein AMELA_G00217920 [Ameiurus melas]|uniref:Uncharacterized protein n=1 Tax=Ameiurus melas TaxID=219545 RepID=A0A7J6A1R9_AMEME|nr:hypothetical protein AMELA_G00217920 [Ameiurus melas]